MSRSISRRLTLTLGCCAALALAACSDDDGKKPDSAVAQDSQAADTGATPDTGTVADGAAADAPVKVDTGAPGKDGAPTKDSKPGKDSKPADAAPNSDAVKPAKCGGKDKVVLQEMAVGSTDFVSLKNLGTAAVTLTGFKVVMTGISTAKPDIYTFKSGSIAAGKVLYVFEYSAGKKTGDVNTGKNIPFYNGPPTASKPNSAYLLDAAGNLLDYVSVGTSVNLPKGASFTPIKWPTSFDSAKSSFQRKASKGKCPGFLSSDWGTAALTR